jgi:hypothetical protein
MSKAPETLELRIPCEMDGYWEYATLILRFKQRHEYTRHVVLACWAEVTTEEVLLKVGCNLLGWDLWRFVQQLTEVHNTLGGSARLRNTIGDLDILVTVVDQTRGILSVQGLVADGLVPPDLPDKMSASTGIAMAFAGLMFDRTRLPDMLTALREFMEEAGIDGTSPFERRDSSPAP